MKTYYNNTRELLLDHGWTEEELLEVRRFVNNNYRKMHGLPMIRRKYVRTLKWVGSHILVMLW